MNRTRQAIVQLNSMYDQLGDGEPLTSKEADVVIKNIKSEKGYLSHGLQQDLQSLQERTQHYLQQTSDLQRQREAIYIKAISQQLFSSKYRFLYELIQNADDSQYTIARSRGDVPKLTFRINRTQCIVDTNEDGFTRANVEAICATGQSLKNHSFLDDYIGEKGFGFKKVFSVAHKVHIQSGIWSFSFKHQRGDDGLGMVTPLITEPAPLPAGVTTRITLTFTDTTPRGYTKLLEAVEDLPVSTIFFLQKIEKITIRSFGLSSHTEKVEEIEKERSLFNRDVKIRQRVTTFDGSAKVSDETKNHTYRVFSQDLSLMPENDARRGRTRAKVELAFPYDAHTNQPKLSERGQHVFAHLPLHILPQIQFLIQSDFIVSANREIIECDWNDALCDGVAEVFSSAVIEFATGDHPLRYSWLDYLPTKPMDGFWNPLYTKIKSLLCNLPILQAWESREFLFPSQLRQVPRSCLYYQRPLFRDLSPNVYLAPEYDERYGDILREFGTELLAWKDILSLLKEDLASPTSRLRNTAPADPWHKKCSQLLLFPFKSDQMRSTQDILKRLAIIPLVGGTQWTHAHCVGPGTPQNIYFPKTKGISIPIDISLKLVDPLALKFQSRRKLFKSIGVVDCPPATVMGKIQETHQWRSEQLTCEGVYTHFRYLFNFHPNPQTIDEWMHAPIESEMMKNTSSQLYFPSTEEYHTHQLIEIPKESRVCFLAKSLVNLEKPEVCRNMRSWIDWLEIALAARYFPALNDEDTPEELSPVILTVLEKKPEKFLGLLKAHWDSEYRATVEKNPALRNILAECNVLCKLGATAKLSSTYLPYATTREAIRRFNVEYGFPLLHLPVTLENSNSRDWEFLNVFGVRVQPTLDLDFYLLILKKKILERSTASLQEVTQIYIAIAAIIRAPERGRIRDFFEKEKAVYGMKSGNLEWRSPKDCTWKAPDFMVFNRPLQNIYGHAVHLEQFFNEVLGVRDAGILDVLYHLRLSSDLNSLSQMNSESIYRYLEESARTEKDWERIRKWFFERPLTFTYGRWHKLSSCVWGSSYSLADCVDLSLEYPKLKNFFVKRLNVQITTPDMLVERLIEIARRDDPDVDAISKRLLILGKIAEEQGMDTSLSDALDRLQNVDFLPIRTANGHVLVGIEDVFAIPDHYRFGSAFAGHDILLDFTPEQTSILNPIFQYLDLSEKYLSYAVEEVSRVGDDVEESVALSQLLQMKAYALYCCAAKFKSVSALADNTTLFDQLSKVRVYTTDDFSTQLILDLENGDQIVKQSDKILQVHFEEEDSKLTLYLPRDRQKRKQCYRNHLPRLLCELMDSFVAEFQIARILNTKLIDLDELLSELDIAEVSWIAKPTFDFDTPDSSLVSGLDDDSDGETGVVSCDDT